MLDLEPKHLEIIKRILKKHVTQHTILAYGSRVKGTSHEGSDLDLVIMDEQKPIPFETQSAIKSAFSESNLPILVDVLAWSTLPENFKQEIMEKHEIVLK